MESKTRGFKPVSTAKRTDERLTSNYREDPTLPVRSTKNSAGYDFFANEDVTVPSIWKWAFRSLGTLFSMLPNNSGEAEWDKILKPTLVKTDVKAYMQEDEALFLYNRSSNPIKKLFLLGNGVGVVDSDYYNNPGNEGNIMFQFFNFSLFDKEIKKGDKIGQGVFQRYLKADNDKAEGERTGGHGSTGE